MRLFAYTLTLKEGQEATLFVQASHRNKADRLISGTGAKDRRELRKATLERLDGEVQTIDTTLTPEQEAWNRGQRTQEGKAEGHVQTHEEASDN